MQGSIAQMIGLVLAANARARGIAIPAPWPNASIFAFCKSVVFFAPGRTRWLRRQRIEMIAADPSQWLERFEGGAAVARLRAFAGDNPALSDRMSVAFVGGGPRLVIEVSTASGPEHWESHWALARPPGMGDRIWQVAYGRIDQGASHGSNAEFSVEDAKMELADALKGILQFARNHNLGFEQSFQNGLAELDSPKPLDEAYHQDLVPDGAISHAAKQLLGACQAGWVFGGMGSWNDNWVADEIAAEHAMWSDRLFNAVVQGALAAANDSALVSD
jgi:hypothetical protein